MNHYKHKGKRWTVDKFIFKMGLGFRLGNAIKYIARAGKKSPDTYIQDLTKAIDYLEREIKQHKKQEQ